MSLFELPPVPEMERASVARDASYDGVFYVAVRSTGIFCRPSCPARKPLPENTEYHATVREALFAGFRPCKRCRPLEADGRLPDWMEALLAEIDADPGARVKNGDLRRRGLEPATVRRHFQSRFGMTFQAFCRARRLGGALSRIREGAELDDVSFSSGYESASGFREAFAKLFGEAPGRSRGADCVRLAWLSSPLGPLVAGATDAGVCLLEFTDRRLLEAQFVTLRRRLGNAVVPGENDHLDRLQTQLGEYFAGRRQRFELPLVLPGSDFQRRVWDALQRIPYGETRSYGELAATLDSPGASRAVGRANGLNRVAIVVPCHRVVTSAGTLGGYGGGVWRKRWLLDLERSHAPGA